MSTLLNQRVVIEALDILGIKNPKSHDLYLQLLGAYSGVRDLLVRPEDDPDPVGIRVDSVSCHYKYMAQDSTLRRVNFVLIGEHDVSQLFLYLIFMEYGLINHISRLSVNRETSTKLIAIASDYVSENSPQF